MTIEGVVVRRGELTDKEKLKHLYQLVAQVPGGIARQYDEINDEYIERILFSSLKSGIILVAQLRDTLVGSIHAYRLQPRCFSHMLSELTIGVDPTYQGLGIGRTLFSTLLSIVKKDWSSIARVELMVRESNTRGIALYESLGFQKEGVLYKRVANEQGILEADICMGWINPVYNVNIQ